MKKPTDNPTSRRQLLHAAGRYGALGGLLVLGGVLMARGRRNREACELTWPCGKCAVFDRCQLSRAAEARKNRREL